MKETFSYYIKIYFTTYLQKTRNLSQSTIKTYKSSILSFLKFLREEKIDLGNIEVQNFDFMWIEKYIVFLQNDNNTPSTINLKITVLKSLFRYIHFRTPSALSIYEKVNSIHLLKNSKKEPDYLTLEEIDILLKQCAKEQNLKEICIITLLYDAGLRVQELCNLKIDNLKFQNNLLIDILSSKNGKSRVVAVGKTTAKVVKLYLKEYAPEEYLFYNKFHSHYTQKGIAYILKKYYEKAKKNCNDSQKFTKSIHPHMLRHSKAMHLLEANVDLITIRDFLGHEHISTTELYARLTTKEKEKILAKNSLKKPLNISRSQQEKCLLENWLKQNI